jgi:hypothetical protein
MMMWTEGVGRKPPAPVVVRLESSDVRILVENARERARLRKYAGNDPWKRGIIQKPLDVFGEIVAPDVRPIVVGDFGEWAAAKYLGGTIDLVLRKSGDGGTDLVIHGFPMQIKLTQRRDGLNLVRVSDHRGRKVEFTARVHVFCDWDESQPDRVRLRGWMWTDDLRPLRVSTSRFGKWRNVSPDADLLLPMARLKDELEARRIYRGTA